MTWEAASKKLWKKELLDKSAAGQWDKRALCFTHAIRTKFSWKQFEIP